MLVAIFHQSDQGSGSHEIGPAKGKGKHQCNGQKEKQNYQQPNVLPAPILLKICPLLRKGEGRRCLGVVG